METAARSGTDVRAATEQAPMGGWPGRQRHGPGSVPGEVLGSARLETRKGRRGPRTHALLRGWADTGWGRKRPGDSKQFAPGSAHRTMEMCQKDTDQFPLVKSRANGGPEDSGTVGGKPHDRTEPRSPRGQTSVNVLSGRAARDVSVSQALPTQRLLITEGKSVASPGSSRRAPPSQAAEVNVATVRQRRVTRRGENPARPAPSVSSAAWAATRQTGGSETPGLVLPGSGGCRPRCGCDPGAGSSRVR